MKRTAVIAIVIAAVAVVVAVVAIVIAVQAGTTTRDCSMYSPSSPDYWACTSR